MNKQSGRVALPEAYYKLEGAFSGENVRNCWQLLLFRIADVN